jgi:hypothetical protein
LNPKELIGSAAPPLAPGGRRIAQAISPPLAAERMTAAAAERIVTSMSSASSRSAAPSSTPCPATTAVSLTCSSWLRRSSNRFVPTLTEMYAPMTVTANPDRTTVMATVRNWSEERHSPVSASRRGRQPIHRMVSYGVLPAR